MNAAPDPFDRLNCEIRGPSAAGRLLLLSPAHPRCVCGGGLHARVHVAGCNVEFLFEASTVQQTPKAILLPTGIKPARAPKRTKRGVTRPWPKSYRLLLQFSFSRPINVALWKQIKAPPGWRKNPTSQVKQKQYRGVRFRCDDLKFALTPEEIETLRAKLYMILELT